MAEKINPKEVLNMVNTIYPKLKDAEDKNVALFNAFKACATGNKGKSYWNGARAFAWYCAAVRNCANAHYRIARMADVYKQLCQDAIKVQQKDNAPYPGWKPPIRQVQTPSSFPAQRNFHTPTPSGKAEHVK